MEPTLSAQEKREALEFLIRELHQHIEEKRTQVRRLTLERNCELVRYEVYMESDRTETLPDLQRQIRQLAEKIQWEEEYLREQESILALYRRKLESLRG